MAGSRGITGLYMKNTQKKVLPFPKPPEEPGAQSIICNIGDQRFAIHYQIEDLPPAVPALLWKQGTKKATPRIVK